MRVLWVDADKKPWTDANGWKVLEDFGLKIQRVSTIAEAEPIFLEREFDLMLVRAELMGAPDFLQRARQQLGGDPQRFVLASSEWSKEQFRAHSKTEGAAHRYARVPMPPEGFLGLVADLFGCTIDEIGSYQLASGKSQKASVPEAKPQWSFPALPNQPKNKAKATHSESEDIDVLRKYLRIQEEQLEISEGEREELVIENDRLQKEAQQLQAKLREFEHLQDELTKKIAQMEESRDESERERLREKEDHDRIAKNQTEKIRALEGQIAEASEKYENLRVRVRKDIRKIRENERDLEARLELLRKDSATLLQARDEKVLDLQRKIDALEFDLDQVQDGRVQAQMEAERYLSKLSRVARALNIAVAMVEEDHVSEDELDELEPLSGGAADAEDIDTSVNEGGSGGSGGAPAGAETPPEEENPLAGSEELSAELAALASDGDPTRMLSSENIEDMGGEPESSSG